MEQMNNEYYIGKTGTYTQENELKFHGTIKFYSFGNCLIFQPDGWRENTGFRLRGDSSKWAKNITLD